MRMAEKDLLQEDGLLGQAQEGGGHSCSKDEHAKELVDRQVGRTQAGPQARKQEGQQACEPLQETQHW